jgi:hypothetical protein
MPIFVTLPDQDTELNFRTDAWCSQHTYLLVRTGLSLLRCVGLNAPALGEHFLP